MNAIVKRLSSLRFSLLLICLLGLMFLLGLWIPQKNLVKDWYFQWQHNAPTLVAFLDALELTDIYTAPITMALYALFFLNLALVMWQRVPVIKGRIRLTDKKIVDPATAGGYPFKRSYDLPSGMDAAAVTGYLGSRGYAVIGGGDGFYAVKNRLSPIAFGIFHLSFFFILLGGLTSVYSQFIGYLELAQGESFHGELARYVQKPRPTLPKIGSPPQVAFTVGKVTPKASGFTETGLEVKIVDGKGRTHDVDINRPYIEDSTSFVLKNLGPAPLLVLKDPSGKEVDGAYVKLNVLKGLSDEFTLGGFTFRTKFYPDYVLYEGKPATRSLEFNNPVFALTASRDGQKLGSGTLSLKDPMEVAGYRLEMREMPFWVRFSVIKEHGVALVYTGFALASLAVIWRLLLYRREMVGAVREENGARRLVVAARSEYYKSLAEEEFGKLWDNLFNKGRG